MNWTAFLNSGRNGLGKPDFCKFTKRGRSIGFTKPRNENAAEVRLDILKAERKIRMPDNIHYKPNATCSPGNYWDGQYRREICRGLDRDAGGPAGGGRSRSEAAEFMNCLRQGRLESVLMPLDETLSIMRTLDAVRAQWGLRYPGE